MDSDNSDEEPLANKRDKLVDDEIATLRFQIAA